MYSSNCCFLTCIQISQEAGQEADGIPISLRIFQFVVIHTAKGFGVVSEAEVDVFLELSCFFNDPTDVGSLISGSSGKGQFSFLSQRKAMPKNAQATTQLHSSHMLVK